MGRAARVINLPYIWIFLMRPVALAAVERGWKKMLISESTTNRRVKTTVYSGTCPNQMCRMYSVSHMIGTAMVHARKKANFEAFSIILVI